MNVCAPTCQSSISFCLYKTDQYFFFFLFLCFTFFFFLLSIYVRFVICTHVLWSKVSKKAQQPMAQREQKQMSFLRSILLNRFQENPANSVKRERTQSATSSKQWVIGQTFNLHERLEYSDEIFECTLAHVVTSSSYHPSVESLQEQTFWTRVANDNPRPCKAPCIKQHVKHGKEVVTTGLDSRHSIQFQGEPFQTVPSLSLTSNVGYVSATTTTSKSCSFQLFVPNKHEEKQSQCVVDWIAMTPCASDKHSTLSMIGTQYVLTGSNVTVIANLRDHDNNPFNHGGATLTFVAAHNEKLVEMLEIIDNDDGSYVSLFNACELGAVDVMAFLHPSTVIRTPCTAIIVHASAVLSSFSTNAISLEVDATCMLQVCVAADIAKQNKQKLALVSGAEVVCQQLEGAPNSVRFGKVKDNLDGTYLVECIATAVGEVRLCAIVSGKVCSSNAVLLNQQIILSILPRQVSNTTHVLSEESSIHAIQAKTDDDMLLNPPCSTIQPRTSNAPCIPQTENVSAPKSSLDASGHVLRFHGDGVSDVVTTQLISSARDENTCNSAAIDRKAHNIFLCHEGLAAGYACEAVPTASNITEVRAPFSPMISTSFSRPSPPLNVIARVPPLTQFLADDVRTTATIEFEPPLKTGGTPIIAYIANCIEDVSLTASIKRIETKVAPLRISVPNLSPDKAYTFVVFAENEIGVSEASAASNLITAITQTDPPTNVRATAAIDYHASVCTDTELVTSEQADFVYVGISVDAAITTEPILAHHPSDEQTIEKSSHVMNKEKSTAAKLDQTHTKPATPVMTMLAPPTLIMLAPPAISMLALPATPAITAVTAGKHEVTVAFTESPRTEGDVIDRYKVTAYSSGRDTGINVSASTKDLILGQFEIVVPRLDASMLYTFVVSSHNAIGWSPPSEPSLEIQPYALPNPPRKLTVLWNSEMATVKFLCSAVLGDGTIPISYYTLCTKGADGNSIIDEQRVYATPSHNEMQMRVFKLVNGSRYTFEVIATNLVGLSSTPVSISGRPCNKPGPPQNLIATRTGVPEELGTHVTATWSPPRDNGGSSVYRYTIYALQSKADGTFRKKPVASTSNLLAEFTLPTNHVCTIEVTATNAAGDGAEARSDVVVMQ
jgi:hypothetical protein